jgi:hypothetical protein
MTPLLQFSSYSLPLSLDVQFVSLKRSGVQAWHIIVEEMLDSTAAG